MRSVLAVMCLSFLIMTGCSEPKVPPAATKPVESNKSITIGLIPEQNIFRQMDRYEPLAGYLSKKIGTKIKLKILPRYGNIIDNFVSGEIDGAFLGSFTYALAHAKLGVEVLARPEDDERDIHLPWPSSGEEGQSYQVGRRYAAENGLPLWTRRQRQDICFPWHISKRHGIRDYRTYLKEVYFAGTHEDVIYDVLNKKADIGAAKEYGI